MEGWQSVALARFRKWMGPSANGISDRDLQKLAGWSPFQYAWCEAREYYKANPNELDLLRNDLDDARNGWEATMVRADELASLLKEARDLLHHTKCRDEDATQCPACSLESRIDSALT